MYMVVKRAFITNIYQGLDLLQGVSKKSGLWKSGTFCFIHQLSNDFKEINLF
jgi:hypothetical protein